jgi:hypothetical protein
LKPIGGKVCEMSCTGLREESSSRIFPQITRFRFDCYNSGTSRWQWIHKEEEEFHGVSDARSYSIPVTPICVNDFVEVSITLMSLMGTLKFQTIKWNPLITEPIPD